MVYYDTDMDMDMVCRCLLWLVRFGDFAMISVGIGSDFFINFPWDCAGGPQGHD